MTDVLSELLAPIPLDDFFETYWGRRFLHIRRGHPGCYDSVLRIEDVDLLLKSSDQRPAAFIKVTTNGRMHPVEEWSRIVELQGREARVAVPERLLDLYRAGATLVFDRAYRTIPRLSQACQLLTAQMGCPAGANIYVTPPGSQGFARHSDDHEVMILHISGAKTFLVYPDDGAGATEVNLEPGDLLYLPRGLAHEGRTDAASSAHVTISFQPVYSFQIIEELAAMARSDPRFQGIVPAAARAAGTPGGFWKQFETDLRELVAENPPGSLASRRRSNLLMRHQRDAWDGRLADLLQIEAMTLDTVCQVRPGLVTRFEQKNAVVKVICGGNSVEVPAFLRKPLEGLMDGQPHEIRGIQGMMTGAGKVRFVKPLVEAGLLTIVKL